MLIFPKAYSPNVSTVSGKVKKVRLVPSKAWDPISVRLILSLNVTDFIGVTPLKR